MNDITSLNFVIRLQRQMLDQSINVSVDVPGLLKFPYGIADLLRHSRSRKQ